MWSAPVIALASVPGTSRIDVLKQEIERQFKRLDPNAAGLSLARLTAASGAEIDPSYRVVDAFQDGDIAMAFFSGERPPVPMGATAVRSNLRGEETEALAHHYPQHLQSEKNGNQGKGGGDDGEKDGQLEHDNDNSPLPAHFRYPLAREVAEDFLKARERADDARTAVSLQEAKMEKLVKEVKSLTERYQLLPAKDAGREQLVIKLEELQTKAAHWEQQLINKVRTAMHCIEVEEKAEATLKAFHISEYEAWHYDWTQYQSQDDDDGPEDGVQTNFIKKRKRREGRSAGEKKRKGKKEAASKSESGETNITSSQEKEQTAGVAGVRDATPKMVFEMKEPSREKEKEMEMEMEMEKSEKEQAKLAKKAAEKKKKEEEKAAKELVKAELAAIKQREKEAKEQLKKEQDELKRRKAELMSGSTSSKKKTAPNSAVKTISGNSEISDSASDDATETELEAGQGNGHTTQDSQVPPAATAAIGGHAFDSTSNDEDEDEDEDASSSDDSPPASQVPAAAATTAAAGSGANSDSWTSSEDDDIGLKLPSSQPQAKTQAKSKTTTRLPASQPTTRVSSRKGSNLKSKAAILDMSAVSSVQKEQAAGINSREALKTITRRGRAKK